MFDVIAAGAAADVPLLLGSNTNDSTLFTVDYPAYANLSEGQAQTLMAT